MTQPAFIKDAINRSYDLHSMLQVLSLAVDGEQIANQSFSENGGQAVIDMAAKLAGELTELLETGDSKPPVGNPPVGD